MGESNHPNPGAEFEELDPPKRLGEQVCELVRGVDVARLDAPFFQAAADEVIPQSDVLAPFVENGVLCQSQGGLAVHQELHRSGVSDEEITKQQSMPDTPGHLG